jgi:uncharacterized protein YdbL (DUF1318 family)
MKKLGIIVVTAALATTSAWAQTTDQSSTQKSGTQGSPGVVTGQSADGGIALQSDAKKTQGTAPAVSGGVSLNARDTLRGSESNANVKMVFALNTGNYVSDVQVKVTDSGGRTVLEDTSNGPWLLARLPAGSYTATATYNGKPVTQKFSVAKSGLRTAQFRWPASVETQAVGAAGADAGGSILGTGPQEPQR